MIAYGGWLEGASLFSKKEKFNILEEKHKISSKTTESFILLYWWQFIELVGLDLNLKKSNFLGWDLIKQCNTNTFHSQFTHATLAEVTLDGHGHWECVHTYSLKCTTKGEVALSNYQYRQTGADLQNRPAPSRSTVAWIWSRISTNQAVLTLCNGRLCASGVVYCL